MLRYICSEIVTDYSKDREVFIFLVKLSSKTPSNLPGRVRCLRGLTDPEVNLLVLRFVLKMCDGS